MATGATDPNPGGRTDIPIDENILSLAHFAVDEYKKQTPFPVQFRGVWSAKQQIVEGTNYWITLEARVGGRFGRYEAHVFVTLDDVKELKDFKPVDNA